MIANALSDLFLLKKKPKPHWDIKWSLLTWER